jgi:cytochrome c-type biogenesis protein CcmE
MRSSAKKEAGPKMKTKRNRFWIEIIAMCSAIACAVALLIATLGAVVSFTAEPAVGQQAQVSATPQIQVQADASQTFEGMVTCSLCGAKHSVELGQSAATCTRSCVRSGATFALVDGEKVYQLDGDLTLLHKIAGQRVRVVGVARGTTITVSSLDAA